MPKWILSSALRPSRFIPPVLALIVVSSWIGNERHLISSLEKESVALKAHLVSRSSDSGPELSSVNPKSSGKTTKKEPLDWKKIAAQMREARDSNDGMGDMRAMIRHQQRIQEMSRDELVSALDEVAALDLGDDARQHLEQMLIGPLIQKEPEFALNRYIDRLADPHGIMGWQLSNGMKEWMKKEPERAVGWFDQQIAAGKFDSKSLDGKSQSRMQFEGAVISTLLTTDTAAAAARLKLLSEDQRADVLRNNTGNGVQEKDQLAFANLVREQLPEKDQAQTLAQQASQRGWGSEGYTEVTEYMDRIEATPAERAVCVEQVAESKIQQISQNKKIAREDIESLRDWATTQSPATLDKVTGAALVTAIQANQKMEFSEAAELATQYQQASGNDEVIIHFLSSGSAYDHKEEAIALAAKITDPKQREEVLSCFK